MRSGLAVAVVAVGLSLAGCERKPRYCSQCEAIHALQDKEGKTKAEMDQLETMTRAFDKQEHEKAAYRKLMDEPPPLHNICDCPSHLHVR